MTDGDVTRREVLTKATSMTPAIVSLPVLRSFAFERFLRDYVGLSRGEGLPPRARGPQAQLGALRAAESMRAFSF